MSIAERIVVRVLTAPIDEPIPMSFSSLRHRQMCLVEVHADGLVGVGESWLNYPPWAAAERVATLIEGVAPLLLGTDVSDPPAVLDRLVGQLAGVGRQSGAPGPIWQAISAVDLALWDLRSIREGVSLTRLLGGESRRVPAYASGVGPTRVTELCELALERGIRAVKAKVGFDHEVDRATVATIRRVAPEVNIFADANCAWSFDEAVRQAAILADEGVVWLEEPLCDDRPEALARLFEQTQLPLAAGENAYGIDELAALAAVPGMSQVQPDPAKSGGVTVASRLESSLTGATVLSPHWYAGAVGLRASIALVSALPRTGWVELDLRENPLRDQLVGDGFPLDDHGRLLATECPGLAADLDHDQISRWQCRVAERSR